jgi:surface antigen
MHAMKIATLLLALAPAALTAFAIPATAAQARSAFEPAGPDDGSVLQCVPYARNVTGIRIYGDAYTWWGQAQGRYARGNRPKLGAVMAIRPHGNSRLGHVAAVSGILDSRTVLLRHANWSAPGQIEDNVRAIDVSPGNDWSEVRIWHAPSGNLGARHWPVYGFIYKDGSPRGTFSVPRPVSKADSRASKDLVGDIIAGRIG